MLKKISLVLLCLVFQAPAQAAPCMTLDSLTWMLGNWHSETDDINTKESWSLVSEKTFEGFGATYSVEKKDFVSTETLRLVEMSGEVFYVAKVQSNDLPIPFKLTHCTDTSAVFENTHHDFPNKISYKLDNPNNIRVFVSGENGKGFSIEFDRE